jgi:putative endonuclease
MSPEASERSERFRRRWAFPTTPIAGSQPVGAYSRTALAVFREFQAESLGSEFAHETRVLYPPKRFVYIIRSGNHPARRYVGVTANPETRLNAHNAGQNRSTAQWRPWCVDVCVEFRTERVALRFERFLRSGAGRAFASRHFVDEAD